MTKRNIDFGELPVDIIQHIQSFLPEEDIVRSSLFSKAWLSARSTLPSLRFHQSRFGLPMRYECLRPEDSFQTKKLRQRFVKMVDDTLRGYRNSKLVVESFDLSVEIAAPRLGFSKVKRWLRFVSQMGLKHLSLTVITNDYLCKIPLEIFSSEALQTLKIEVDGLGEWLYCPHNPRIRCFSLQTLKLHMVHISDKLISNLISNCPLLEEITLSFCGGFERIQIKDLHHLRVFNITALNNEIVEIDAPSLRSFTYSGDGSVDNYCRFNIDASTSLTRLELHCVRMKRGFFRKFVSRFPVLEELIVCSNYAMEGIDIACPSLTELSISNCLYLEDFKVDAPKLVRFSYCGSPVTFQGVDADQLKADPNFECVECRCCCICNERKTFFYQLKWRCDSSLKKNRVLRESSEFTFSF